jgi:hypothetical protein
MRDVGNSVTLLQQAVHPHIVFSLYGMLTSYFACNCYLVFERKKGKKHYLMTTSEYKQGKLVFNIPGGKAEVDETPDHTIVREVIEEVLNVHVTDKVIKEILPKFRDAIIIKYKIVVKEGDPASSLITYVVDGDVLALALEVLDANGTHGSVVFDKPFTDFVRDSRLDLKRFQKARTAPTAPKKDGLNEITAIKFVNIDKLSRLLPKTDEDQELNGHFVSRYFVKRFYDLVLPIIPTS